MPRRIALEPHCTQDELEARHRPARDPIERNRWRFLWLLARGLTATNAPAGGRGGHFRSQVAPALSSLLRCRVCRRPTPSSMPILPPHRTA